MLKFLFRLFLTALIAVIVGIGGLATAKRMQTGSWSLPNKDDIAWLRHVISPDEQTPRVIFVNRDELMVSGGYDNAHGDHTQLIDRGDSRVVPGFRGSKRNWRQIMSCVRRKFKDFDVEVTDKRPDSRGYIMVHVGGQPRDLFGRKRMGMGGVAPFNGDVISNVIVFAFSRTLDERTEVVCDTIAHEVGHVYGLDHSYRCSDIMTYLHGCKKRFVDAVVRCGENKRRDCDNGHASQNSFRRLLDVLGPRKQHEHE